MPGAPNQSVLCAVCTCDKGSAPSTLVTGTAPTVTIEGRMVATIADVQFAGKFGNCGILCAPCDYAPGGPWSVIVSTLFFGGQPPLVQGALLPCKEGGILTVVEVGQASLGSGRPSTADLAAYAEQALQEDCFSPGYVGPDTPFDATYVDRNGVVVILNNVTQAELQQYKDTDEARAFIEELDAYRADPIGYATHETLSGLAKGGAGVVEGRTNNTRNSIPVTRAR